MQLYLDAFFSFSEAKSSLNKAKTDAVRTVAYSIIIATAISGNVLSTSLYHEFHETFIPLHSLYGSIHTKDESKRGTAFAFIFGVN